MAATTAGQLAPWSLHNPHPEITWRSLFGKVHYEGYEKPEHVWQSTGGTDDFSEAYFGLLVRLKNGQRNVLLFLSDPEGNGPGSFELGDP